MNFSYKAVVRLNNVTEPMTSCFVCLILSIQSIKEANSPVLNLSMYPTLKVVFDWEDIIFTPYLHATYYFGAKRLAEDSDFAGS